MSKFILFSKFNRRHQVLTKTSKTKKLSVNPKTIRLFVICLLIGMGVFYLAEINQVSTLGFRLRTLQDEVNQLKVSNEKLEIEAAQMKSMERIESLSEELGLISTGEILYLDLASSEVAAK